MTTTLPAPTPTSVRPPARPTPYPPEVPPSHGTVPPRLVTAPQPVTAPREMTGLRPMSALRPVAAASDTPTADVPAARAAGRVWAYLGIVLGAVVSVAANVAHSYVRPPDLPTTPAWTPETGAVLGATFWPIALLITTEIMIRTSWPPGRAWLLLRFVGLLPVAGVAGVVSYLHLHGLLQHYHEAPLTCLIAPLSVDGLMVMASSALLAHTTTPHSTAADSTRASADGHDPTVTAADVTTDSTTTTAPDVTPLGRRPVQASSAVTGPGPDIPGGPPDGWCEACRARPATRTWSRPPAGQPFQLCDHCLPEPHHPTASADTDTGFTVDTSPDEAAEATAPLAVGRAARPRDGHVSTATAVSRLRHQEPGLTTTDIARRLGVSTRTVRRHLATHRTTTTPTTVPVQEPGPAN